MTAIAKQRLQALAEQLVAPVPDQGMFEDIPKLKKIAPDSTGPRVKDKVVIITGKGLNPLPPLPYSNESDKQERTHLLELEEHPLTSLPLTEQKQSISATTMTRISRLTSANSHLCIPPSKSTLENSMLQTRSL